MTAPKNEFYLFVVAFVVIGLALSAGCSKESVPAAQENANESADDHSHDLGPHDGAVIVVGTHLAHLEMLRNCDSGKITCYLLDSEMKDSVEADGPLKINLKTEDGSKQLTAQGVDGGLSVFECTDPALAAHEVDGQFVISIGGNEYFLEIPDHHHHDVVDDDQGHENETDDEHDHEGDDHDHEGDDHDQDGE